MSVKAIEPVVQSLREFSLLSAAQLEEAARDLAPRCADARALAQELIRRGWITPFQANRLLQGKGRELLLGSYLLLERLGRGGMGEVYRARHVLMGRIVALKIIRSEFLTRPATVSRFQHEIQAASRVAHPNVVLSYDASQVGGTYFLVMEYVEGTDLGGLLGQRGRLPVGEACDYLRQAALGLQHVHECGLVHRDIKPSNLLLSSRDRIVKILDLGLARLRSESDGNMRATWLTQEGDVMGTPDYLAPEQARDSRNVDIRADIYSLGCTGYHLLAGRPPFPGGTLTDKLLRHQQIEPEPLRRLVPELPAELESVVHKMLAKRPQDRYQTPAEVAAALQPFAHRSSVPQALPAAVKQPSDASSQVETRSYHVPEQETPTPVPLAMPRSATRRTDALANKRRLFRIGAGAGVVSVGVLVLWLLLVSGKEQSVHPAATATETSRVGNNDPLDGVEPIHPHPPRPERPVAWHEEMHALLAHIMPKGMDSPSARMAYTKIMDALDRGEDREVSIGGALTRDHKAYVIQLKDGRITSRPLTDEEAKARNVHPQSIGSAEQQQHFALYGGQLVTLERADLQLRRDEANSLWVEGRILCRGSVKQPLTDASLMLLRRFRKGDSVYTLTRYQSLDLTETPSGWQAVKVDLPTEQSLSPKAVGAIADTRIDLLLIAFVSEPQPRIYEISNTLPLLIQEGRLTSDPDLTDGRKRIFSSATNRWSC